MVTRLDPTHNFTYGGANIHVFHANKGEGIPMHTHEYIAAVPVDGAQRRDRFINVVRYGKALSAGLHLVPGSFLAAEEGKDDQFSVLSVSRYVCFDHLPQVVGGYDCGFAKDADNGVDAFGLQCGVEGLCIVRRRRISGHVDGILRGTEGWDDRCEGLLEVLCIVVKGNGVFLAGIRRHHARPPAVGDDHGVFAARKGVVGDEFAPVEGFLGAFSAQRPALPGDGVEEVVGPGERTGMGSRRHGAPLGPSRLDDDHGLYTGGALQRRDELLAVADSLDVHEHHVRVVVALKIFEEIRFVDVRFVAHRYDGRKAYVFHCRVAHQRKPQGAALRNHGQMPAGDVAGDEGRIEIRRGGINPEDVRAEDAHAVVVRVARNFPLFFEIAYFRKTSRDDNGIFYLVPAQVLDGGKDELGRDCENGQVDIAFDLLQRAPDRKSFDLTAGGIDRINGAPIPAREDIL